MSHQVGYNRGQVDRSAMVGRGVATLYGPDGGIKQAVPFTNMITDVGDQMYGEGGAGVSGAVAPPTGMRLGDGLTAPSKSGPGATIVSYVPASDQTLSGLLSEVEPVDGGWNIIYQATWGAGVAVADDISEVVLTNEPGPTDDPGSEANTISRGLLPSVVNKGPEDILIVNWTHNHLGA